MCWRFAMRPSKNRGLTAILFLTGGSYGGYLTAWTVTQDHRFKAAVAQRCMTFPCSTPKDGLGGWWRPPTVTRTIQKLPNCCAGQPSGSADAIKTPLLILHGDRDRRTGFVQSEMLYRALERRGAAVELVRHGLTSHNLADRPHGGSNGSIDPYRRLFDRYDASKRIDPLFHIVQFGVRRNRRGCPA